MVCKNIFPFQYKSSLSLKSLKIINWLTLTSNIDLSQALHEGNLHGAQHVLVCQPPHDLGLRPLHHQHAVDVHAAHVQMPAPGTDGHASWTGGLAPDVVRYESAGPERIYVDDILKEVFLFLINLLGLKRPRVIRTCALRFLSLSPDHFTLCRTYLNLLFDFIVPITLIL